MANGSLPYALHCFAQWLNLDERCALRLWRAAARSRSPTVRMWYRSLSYRQKGRLDHLLQTQLHPKTVVRVLEALVDDHGLTRAESNGMMELVFERMKHDGTWR